MGLARLGVGDGMIDPENKLLCHLDGMNTPDREQQRLLVITQLGLLEAGSVPVFEEATQTAAHFLQAPICILSIMDRDRQWFKAAVGLSRLGLMNELAASRSLPRRESFCTQVVESRKAWVIPDTLAEPTTRSSILAQHYGIRAYLSVPIFASSGQCLGTLAVMDLEPRTFTGRDIEYLELTARWSMSEFERNCLLKAASSERVPSERGMDRLVEIVPEDAESANLEENLVLGLSSRTTHQQTTAKVKIDLLHQLTQELRTPLTSVMGMASVLSRETFGPLTNKQKEYLDIIHHSGQYLLSMVNEILELGIVDSNGTDLKVTSVDIEMLCQQVINSLEQVAKRRDQNLRLSVEPGNRIWLLDKTVVRQILYHLLSSVIQSAETESIVRLHVSRRNSGLTIAVWVSHPWLGEGLPFDDADLSAEMIPVTSPVMTGNAHHCDLELYPIASLEANVLTVASEASRHSDLQNGAIEDRSANTVAENLRLLLSRLLVQLHGGKISMQGSSESGYRYVISFPDMTHWEGMV